MLCDSNEPEPAFRINTEISKLKPTSSLLRAYFEPFKNKARQALSLFSASLKFGLIPDRLHLVPDPKGSFLLFYIENYSRYRTQPLGPGMEFLHVNPSVLLNYG